MCFANLPATLTKGENGLILDPRTAGCWSMAERRISVGRCQVFSVHGGRRKGSKGRLASFLGSRIRRRGKEIPREFYLFDVCFMSIQRANMLCNLPLCWSLFDRQTSSSTRENAC